MPKRARPSLFTPGRSLLLFVAASWVFLSAAVLAPRQDAPTAPATNGAAVASPVASAPADGAALATASLDASVATHAFDDAGAASAHLTAAHSTSADSVSLPSAPLSTSVTSGSTQPARGADGEIDDPAAPPPPAPTPLPDEDLIAGDAPGRGTVGDDAQAPLSSDLMPIATTRSGGPRGGSPDVDADVDGAAVDPGTPLPTVATPSSNPPPGRDPVADANTSPLSSDLLSVATTRSGSGSRDAGADLDPAFDGAAVDPGAPLPQVMSPSSQPQPGRDPHADGATAPGSPGKDPLVDPRAGRLADASPGSSAADPDSGPGPQSDDDVPPLDITVGRGAFEETEPVQANLATVDGDVITLDTGLVSASMGVQTFELFESMTVEGHELVPTDVTVTLEQNDATTAVVRADGVLVDDDGAAEVAFTYRVIAHLGATELEVQLALGDTSSLAETQPAGR